eukprot:6629932-Pyramimonas_sp.AAC.1
MSMPKAFDFAQSHHFRCRIRLFMRETTRRVQAGPRVWREGRAPRAPNKKRHARWRRWPPGAL